ncbi:hypothetical protein M0R45_020823 [Rubus argutus]|uniref:MHC class I antigen n=1 Tax=Rubus argutus TaxID=59490 RepID=A0AAW1X9Y5_RUBAR
MQRYGGRARWLGIRGRRRLGATGRRRLLGLCGVVLMVGARHGPGGSLLEGTAILTCRGRAHGGWEGGAVGDCIAVHSLGTVWAEGGGWVQPYELNMADL